MAVVGLVVACGDNVSQPGAADAGVQQPVTLELIAGDIGGAGNLDGTGADARFDGPLGVALDSGGTLYVSDGNNFSVRRVTVNGAVSTLGVKLDQSVGCVAVDSAGTAYVPVRDRITKISSSGAVTTLPLTGTSVACGLGSALLCGPSGVTVDSSGTIYVADNGNSTIRKITPDGAVATVAGVPEMTGSTDGAAASALFNAPSGIAIDTVGNLYVADTYNHTIREITSGGVVSTLAGTAGMYGSADGAGAAARFNGPTSVSVDAAGNVYVTDAGNNTIRKITSGGVVSTIAGTAGIRGEVDGFGVAASFSFPTGIAIDGSGTMYVGDGTVVRKIASTGLVSTFVGAAERRGTSDGSGATVRFSDPSGVAADNAGTIYVADGSNATIRAIAPTGEVSTLAGTPTVTGSADGAGAAAEFNLPTGIAVDNAGNIYVADSTTGGGTVPWHGATVRKISSNGVVTTWAGKAGAIGNDDGEGTVARFCDPRGVAVDATGNVYVGVTNDLYKAYSCNASIRKITTEDVVSTLNISGSTSVAVDSTNSVYFTDGNAIRRLSVDGTVTTLATVGIYDWAVRGIALDHSGNLYVADAATIRKITPDGVITTVAGGDSAIGIRLGSSPSFATPLGLAVVGDALVISDTQAILLLRHGAQ